jgi:PII-like signaling protein
VRVCKRDGVLLAAPHALPGTDEHGLALWQKLMVYASEQARHEGRPLHQELMRRLRQGRACGATTLRGVWGFHGDHAPHGDKLLQLRRHAPTLTITVDTPDRIMDAFAIVDELTDQRGLVTSEMVPASAALAEGVTRGGLRLARHRF